MSDKCFLDTNIFLYAHDTADLKKRILARKLIQDVYNAGICIISTQVMAEFFQNFVAKFGHPYADALKEMHFMSRAPVIEQSLSLLLSGAKLFMEYSLSYWDSMIIAAAAEGDAAILYSEDLQHNQIISGVKVVNPFI